MRFVGPSKDGRERIGRGKGNEGGRTRFGRMNRWLIPIGLWD